MISEYLIKKAAGSTFSTLMDVIKKNPYIIAGGGLGMGAGVWAGNQLSKDEEDPEGTWTGRILGGLTGTALGAIGGNALQRHFNQGIDEKARVAYDNSHDEIAFLGTPEGQAAMRAKRDYEDSVKNIRSKYPVFMSKQQSQQCIDEILEAQRYMQNELDKNVRGGINKYRAEHEALLNSKYGELF